MKIFYNNSKIAKSLHNFIEFEMREIDYFGPPWPNVKSEFIIIVKGKYEMNYFPDTHLLFTPKEFMYVIRDFFCVSNYIAKKGIKIWFEQKFQLPVKDHLCF